MSRPGSGPIQWRQYVIVLGLLAATPTSITGCSPTTSTPTLSIFAAASLRAPFEALAQTFESEHKDVQLKLNFAGSQVLRFQISRGAPADLFASANPVHLQALLAQEKLTPPHVFAGNRLAIVVPRVTKSSVSSPATLTMAKHLVLGTEASPIGQYSRQYLRRAAKVFGKDFYKQVMNQVASLETNVRLILTRVELGAADAGIVYETDALRSQNVRVIPIPVSANVMARYSMATVTRTKSAAWAEKWRDFVLSDTGQRILVRHGFIGFHDTR